MHGITLKFPQILIHIATVEIGEAQQAVNRTVTYFVTNMLSKQSPVSAETEQH